MRINKYIASCGITSRRKADQLILDGRVAVNGVIMREPGYNVKQGEKEGLFPAASDAQRAA